MFIDQITIFKSYLKKNHKQFDNYNKIIKHLKFSNTKRKHKIGNDRSKFESTEWAKAAKSYRHFNQNQLYREVIDTKETCNLKIFQTQKR